MTTLERQTLTDSAYKRAMQIMDEEWLTAGKSPLELEQEQRLAEIFDAEVSSGRSVDVVLTEWEAKSVEQILCEYTPELSPAVQSHPAYATKV